MANKYVSTKPTRLTQSISATDTSLTVASIQDRYGNTLSTSDFVTGSSVFYIVLEPDTDNEEHISATTITGTTISGIIRGIEMKSPYTANTANRKAHGAGARVIILSNTPAFYNEFLDAENDETITGQYTFSASNPPEYDSHPTFTNDEQIVDKKYVDDVALAGAPDASDTTKGVLEVATQTEVDTGAAAGSGGTSADLAVTASKFLAAQDREVTTDYTYGATIAVGDVLYLDTADAKWKLADGSAAATADNTFGVALEAGVDTDTGKRVLIGGVATTVTGLSTAGVQYLSDTAGNVSTTAGTYKKVVGFSPDGSSMLIGGVARIEDLAGGSTNWTTSNLESALAYFNSPLTQNLSYTATAGQDLSQGDVVAVESDGDVYRTRITDLDGTQNAETESSGGGSSAFSTSIVNPQAFDTSDPTKKVFFHANTSPRAEFVQVTMDATLTTISSISRTSVSASSATGQADAVLFDTDKAAVAYRDGSAVEAVIANTLAGSIAFGTAVTVAASGEDDPVIASHSSSEVIIFTRDAGTGIRSHQYTISGSTLTAGTSTTMFSSSDTLQLRDVVKFGSSNYYAIVFDNTTTGDGSIVIGEYNSGTGLWTSIGSETQVDASGFDGGVVVRSIEGSDTVIALASADGSDRAVRTISRSGTTATVNSETTIFSVDGSESNAFIGMMPLGRYTFLVSARQNTSNVRFGIAELNPDLDTVSVTGATLNISTTAVSSNDQGGTTGILVTPTRLLLQYAEDTSSLSHKTVETDTNFAGVIGICAEDIIDASTGSIDTAGYNSDVTGLTAGTRYYTGLDGELINSNATGTVFKVGTALSATSFDIDK